MQLNLTKSICCFNEGTVEFKLNIVCLTEFKEDLSKLFSCCLICCLNKFIWFVYCTCWVWKAAIVLLRFWAWVSKDWALTWSKSFYYFKEFILLFKATFYALTVSIWAAVFAIFYCCWMTLADINNRLLWASCNCFWSATIKASASVKEFWSIASIDLAVLSTLVSYWTVLRLTVIFRL